MPASKRYGSISSVLRKMVQNSWFIMLQNVHLWTTFPAVSSEIVLTILDRNEIKSNGSPSGVDSKLFNGSSSEILEAEVRLKSTINTSRHARFFAQEDIYIMFM
jgi:hypothetical protein